MPAFSFLTAIVLCCVFCTNKAAVRLYQTWLGLVQPSQVVVNNPGEVSLPFVRCHYEGVLEL